MKFTAAALLGAVSAKSFPGFSSLHAHCELSLTINASCADTYAAFDGKLKSFTDPAGGDYAIVQESAGSSVWVTRTTPVKHYVDDIIFEVSGTGATCNVVAKSQSQSLSYYDYDTNYCNMYNVFRNSGLTFGAITPSECKWVPDDAATTCNKY